MTPEERISLVEQLRQPWTHYGKYNEPSYDRLRLIAADEIERMEAALASGSPQVAATALSQAEGAPDRDAVLAAVLHEFGPDGCAKVLARLPEARDYVNALRKPTRPREQAAKHKWVYHGGLGYTQCAHCGVMRVAAISEDCPREQEGAAPVAWRYRYGNTDYWKWCETSPTSFRMDTPVTLEPLYAHPPASFQAGAEAMRKDICTLLQKLRPAGNPKSWDQWDRGEDAAFSTAISNARSAPLPIPAR